MYMMGGIDQLLQFNAYNGFQNNQNANQIVPGSNLEAK